MPNYKSLPLIAAPQAVVSVVVSPRINMMVMLLSTVDKEMLLL